MWTGLGLGFLIGGWAGERANPRGSGTGQGAETTSPDVPPDERQQPRHRADEVGPFGAPGCASRGRLEALVDENFVVGCTDIGGYFEACPIWLCRAAFTPLPREAFSKAARERGTSSGRRRGLAPAADPRDTTSASPATPDPARYA